MHLKDAEGIINSKELDQTAPLVCYGFAIYILAQELEFLSIFNRQY